MKLILARHAETEANRDGINQGWLDSPLTARGKAQAEALTKKLLTLEPEVIYTSDLGRCLATLEPLRKLLDIPVHEEPALREGNLGTFEGTSYGEIRKEAARRGVLLREFDDVGVESIPERARRVTALLERLPRKRVLFMTHGGPIIDILLHVLGEPQERYRDFLHENAHYTVLELNGETRVLALNEEPLL